MNGESPERMGGQYARPAIDVNFYSFPLGLRFQQRWVGEQECEFFVEAKTRDGPQQRYVKPGFILAKLNGVDIQATSLADLSAELAKYKGITGRDRPLKLSFLAVDTSGQGTPLFDPFHNKNELDRSCDDQTVQKFERTAIQLPMTTFALGNCQSGCGNCQGRGCGSCGGGIATTMPLGANDVINANDLRKHMINVDSDFRSDPNDPSTNFVIYLDPEIKNVLRIRLASAEIPNTYYEFSSKKRNTKLTLICPTATPQQRTFQILDGNYTATQLQTAIQTAFDTAPSPNYKILIDPITAKTTIYTEGYEEFAMDFRTEYNSSEVNPDLNGEVVNDWGLAYNLGFRRKVYDGENTYKSEAIINTLGDQYFFLRINDYFTIQQPYPDRNILQAFTKIICRTDKNTELFNDGSDLLTREYIFQQPTNISRLRIRLIDKYGEPIDLHDMPISLSLEITEVMNCKLYDFYKNYLFQKRLLYS